ncbi:hypothetical protein GCM10028793_01110 [Nocardiopsis oceani]
MYELWQAKGYSPYLATEIAFLPLVTMVRCIAPKNFKKNLGFRSQHPAECAILITEGRKQVPPGVLLLTSGGYLFRPTHPLGAPIQRPPHYRTRSS